MQVAATAAENMDQRHEIKVQTDCKCLDIFYIKKILLKSIYISSYVNLNIVNEMLSDHIKTMQPIFKNSL